MRWLPRTLCRYWRTFTLILVPLVLLPIPIQGETKAARCGYTILIMAIFWMAEVVPLPVTGVIPVILFPLLGIMDTGDVCKFYMKESIMMFLGGLIVAISVEHCKLHKRIALKVLLIVGTSPRLLMLGFMLNTMFLSMWISNTATTAMMVPIVEAVLEELNKNKERGLISQEADAPFIQQRGDNSSTGDKVDFFKGDHSSTEDKVDFYKGDHSSKEDKVDIYEMLSQSKHDDDEEEVREVGDAKRDKEDDSEDSVVDTSAENRRVSLFLAVAYAANIGGTGTQTGTGPNIVLKGMLQDHNTGLNFATWMIFCVPGMVVNVLLAWLWLQLLFLGFCRKESDYTKKRTLAIRQLIQRSYDELGSLTFHEASVLTMFITLVLLWLFRNPQFVPGWAMYLPETKIGDSTSSMIIVFLLFVLPSNLRFLHSQRPKETPSLIDWQTVHEKLPWGLILLLGGGFAVAEAAKVSGLSELVGRQLRVLEPLPSPAIIFFLCMATALVTEVASNTATASIVLPVVANLAAAIKVNPLFLMLPTTITCSYAFMLPVATPPNAIVYTASKMKIKQMIKAGAMMNLISVVVVMTMINTYGVPFFDLHTFPEWAVTNSTNTTHI